MSSIKDENAQYVGGKRTEAPQSLTTLKMTPPPQTDPPQVFEPFIYLTGRVHKRRQPSCVHLASF
ncbi:hypothetical protein [Pelagicoccus sp. SDUM812003]|uniref:hypothetical protein n=1 Tax=Pelagicoccus sp. SDUM812003 TaxID=3041267 RepID=UPI00280D78C5|nr:hypothetical protein [Pelagicoccus sp. SDUM812003]MDQ8201529.1 hypothetical protein [Pelagicoccus sp. SDUM812003]